MVSNQYKKLVLEKASRKKEHYERRKHNQYKINTRYHEEDVMNKYH